MTEKFWNVKIEDLTDSQCRELLMKINDLVADMPSYTEIDRDGVYGRIYDPYICCSGYTNQGHDENCSIGQLKYIFGY
jgi:hypothetical protein